MGLCRCGCGEKTPLYKYNYMGSRVGDPRPFIPGHELRKPKRPKRPRPCGWGGHPKCKELADPWLCPEHTAIIEAIRDKPDTHGDEDILLIGSAVLTTAG